MIYVFISFYLIAPLYSIYIDQEISNSSIFNGNLISHVIIVILFPKVKSSRAFFNEVNKRFPTLPFSLRSLPDEKVRTLRIIYTLVDSN